jgi:regulator of sigma E protease
MLAILNYISYGVVLIIILMVLVAAHEYGHYLFARIFNMGVEEFAIGMGKPKVVTYLRKRHQLPVSTNDELPEGVQPGDEFELQSQGMSMEGGTEKRFATLKRTDKGLALEEVTDFTIRPYPFGGFVRIKGMIPQADGGETRVPGGFYSKPPFQRLIVLFAGPLFSIITGIILLVPVFMFDGKEEPLNKPILGAVEAKTPADVAGLKSGDRITAIDGAPINTFFEMIQKVRTSAGKELVFSIERQGVALDRKVMPAQDAAPSPVLGPDLRDSGSTAIQGKIGVAYTVEKAKLSFGDALATAVDTPRRAIWGMVVTFSSIAGFERSVGGPGTMYKLSEQAVNLGFAKVISLAALLSISVGIFNLLPIYPLDGGQMVVAFVEMLRGGKRLSMRLQELIGTVGFAMVLLLFVSVLIVDVKRWMPKGDPGPALVAPTKK